MLTRMNLWDLWLETLRQLTGYCCYIGICYFYAYNEIFRYVYIYDLYYCNSLWLYYYVNNSYSATIDIRHTFLTLCYFFCLFKAFKKTVPMILFIHLICSGISLLWSWWIYNHDIVFMFQNEMAKGLTAKCIGYWSVCLTYELTTFSMCNQ